jgi:hypothetical protein
MDIVEATQIYNFLPVEQQVDVPSSEEPVFILTSSQLQDIITNAVEKATQPLKGEISRLNQRIASLESLHDQDVSRICLDIAYDRQRLARLEKVEPQPLQKDRGEILRALLAANDGKMLAKDARQKMHLRIELFSMLLASMKDSIDIKPLHSDKRKMVLTLK